MTAGAAVGTDAESARLQGDVIKHHNDPLGRDVIVSAQLQHAAAGEVHKGLRLEKKQLLSAISALAVKTLEFHPVDLAAQFFGKFVDGTETGVVPGALILLAGVAQTDDQPGIAAFSKHAKH